MQGIIFNIQRFSLFDGPGVRTVVFLKGCPLRCLWCHNPEGLSGKPQLMVDPARCVGCGECVQVCPQGAHGILSGGQHGFDRAICTSCGTCADACCSGALAMAGQTVSTEEVMAEVLRDLSLYRESRGGLTLSGGEPLYQGEFTLSLLKAAKEQGIHTCLETCGLASSPLIREAAAYTDLFYYDYKATGEDMHKTLTGVSQRPILENLALLDQLGAYVVLRCPIIPTMNNTDAHITGIGETAKKYPCIKEIHLEPYHRLGVSKAAKLAHTPVYDGNPPDPAVMEAYRARIADISHKKCIIS